MFCLCYPKVTHRKQRVIKTKILHYVDENRLAWGETWIQLIKELGVKGIDNHVVCKSGGTLSDRLKEEGVSFETCDIPIQCLPFSARGFGRIVRNSDPNIIHTRLSSAAFTGGYWGKKFHVPVIHTIDKYPKPYYYRNGTLLIPCSHAVKDHMLSIGFAEEKMQVMHNPIDVKRYLRDEEVRTDKRKELNLEDKIIIMSAGRFVDWKGFEYVIKAYGKILSSSKSLKDNTSLLLVGSGPEKFKYLELLKKLGIEENVIFHEFVQDIRPWLWASDIFVQPSQSPEGFSLMLLEAMASSLSVMTTNIGGSLDIIKDKENGWLIEISDFDKMAEILNHILTDKKTRDTVSANAVKTASYFNVSRIAEETIRKYEKVLIEGYKSS